MKIQYSKELQKTLKDEKTIKRNYGNFSNRILMCISVLMFADTLATVPNVPPTRRHKLVNEVNKWALDVSPNWRMTIEGIDGNDPSSITEVKIVTIEDYH